MSIEVRGISKRFGAFVALDEVSLEFPTGELVALLGPSGCGKTTLLRIIAGLEHADAGSLWLDGEEASGTHVRERQVGFVFQHYALFRHKTVFENVAFGLRMRPRRQRPAEPEIRRRVDELLELVQLGWVRNRFPAQLSGGQRQRIALARALAVQPRVLLLDEPFGALDAKVRKELRRWLRRLHDELHVTSVFVTHDQEEALEVADQIVLMNRGRIEQVGTRESVSARPASPFVFGFLGTANRLEGRVEAHGVCIGGTAMANLERLPVGTRVEVFARPHELDLRPAACTRGGLPAVVTRLLPGGLTVRVELAGRGAGMPEHLEVECLATRVPELALAPGVPVRLVPRELRVFPITETNEVAIA